MKLRFLIPILTLALSAQDWPRFRGPNGSGVSGESGFPTEFGPARNVLWKVPVRAGKSSPVLTSRHIFLTACENGKLYTQCFDRKTGKLLWERSQTRPRAEVANTRNDPAAITPVTDGENIYAFFADFGLVSYDPAGAQRWRLSLGPFNNTMGLGSSPIMAGSNVILVIDQNEDSYMAAFDRRNGEIRWKQARAEKDGWASPLLYEPRSGGAQIVTTSRSQLGLHRARDGERTWTYDRLSPAIVASPILDGDVLYTFGYGHDEPSPFAGQLAKFDKNHDGQLSPDEYGKDPMLLALGKYAGNRDLIVTREEWDEKQRQVVTPSILMAVKLGPKGPRELWRYEKNFVGVVPSPLLFDGVLYVIRNGGILAAFDPATGKPGKTARVQGALGAYSASPVAADGKIFLASEEGKIAVLRAGPEWEVLAVNELNESCYATPALSDGKIFVRTSEALYCFGAGNR